MGKDVHHGEEEYAGGGALGADERLELQNFVGFPTHESCWCGVVEGESRDRELKDSPERNWTGTRASDDDAPGPCVHDV